MHSKYLAEYDCPTPEIYDGEKMYHQKGERAPKCKACERYIVALEKKERGR